MSCWDRELTKTEAAGNCSQTPSLPQPCCRGRRAKASLIRRQRSVPAPISSPFRHRIARGLPRRLPACMLPPPSRSVCVSPRFSIVSMRSTTCSSTTSARTEVHATSRAAQLRMPSDTATAQRDLDTMQPPTRAQSPAFEMASKIGSPNFSLQCSLQNLTDLDAIFILQATWEYEKHEQT